MTKRILFFSAILFFLLSIPGTLSSQQSTTANVQVEGSILDSLTNETIPYATIKVYDKTKPQQVEKVVPSDADGKFRFTMNKKGDYLMTVEFVGKNTVKKEFIVGNEKRINMGNILMEEDSKLLGEVVVTSQRPLVKVDLDKITYNMEDDPESKTNNVLEMLKKVPMVSVDGEDNIQLKGSTSFKIYMNGKPSNMISSNPKDILKSMPANTVKDIEIITDPGAKYDAEGVAGIINIITQKNSSMVGYNARVNTGVDTRGGYNLGANLTLKAGKFGFMGYYNLYQHKSPGSTSYSFRELYDKEENKYQESYGEGDGKGTGQFGSGELSYEIDTLNLINVGFNRYHGKWKNNSASDVNFYNVPDGDPTNSSHKFLTDGENVYGYTGINFDYQRTSATVKDRLLTFSYRFGTSPEDWSSDNTRDYITGKKSIDRQYSDGKMNEHTFQIDYTTPFAKIHTWETGVKYILRQNESESKKSIFDNDKWIDRNTPNDRFKHTQDILSAYLGYSVKVKKVGFKAGLRYEYTDVEGKYPSSETDNFGKNYSTLVPSATATYQIKPMQTMRVGYNMRIWRPSIWNLNPFVNTTDSTKISYGNPELDAVKSHSVNMNYSYFNPKFNFNANLSYDFTNNNIERFIFVDDNSIINTTYRNIGKNRRLNLYTYVNWTPSQKLRINGNLSGSYSDLRAEELNLKNSGWQGRVYMNASYTFPYKIRLNGYGGVSSKYIGLQSNGSSYNYHGFSLSKDFLNDNLNIRLSASNPFTNTNTYKNETYANDVYELSESINKVRYFGINVSFKFGEMKSQIKKARRSISNDDTMGGGGGGQGQGGGQPQ